MTGEGFLLLSAILIGAPIAVIAFGVWFDWWIHRQLQNTVPLAYDGLHGTSGAAPGGERVKVCVRCGREAVWADQHLFLVIPAEGFLCPDYREAAE